jgi:prolyl-tRNA editing enzyme YbaK/EbsC (Cys-tRNA(Pro) deacylase)
VADEPGEVTGDPTAPAQTPTQDWAHAEQSVDAALSALPGLPDPVGRWEMIDCDPDLADTEAFCRAYGYAPEDSANTIVVAAKEDPPRYVACVVLANTRLDVNRVVRKRLGTRKASFATAEETRALTGMAIGGVTAIGLPAGMPVWVDAAVTGRPQIVLGGGSRRRKLVCAPDLLLSVPGVEVIDGLAQPGSPSGSVDAAAADGTS